jgi:glycosyltransferase involved in cell wall biosynthesis
MTAEITHPVLTIGLPVYNGARYLEEAIQSILGQEFRDYELILSDNGSTDATESICLRFAQQDERVKYHREPMNKGASWNFNNVVHLAKGRYFKWAASDDLHAPGFVAKCLPIIQSRPDVAICFSQTEIIDADGLSQGVYDDPMKIQHATPSRRFFYLLRNLGLCDAVYGIMRTEDLRRTGLLGAYNGSDIVLLAEISLQGIFFRIEEPLFFRRIHANASAPSNPSPSALAAWFDPANRNKMIYRNWLHLKHFLVGIRKARIPLGEKAACVRYLGRWCLDMRSKLIAEAAMFLRQKIRLG